MGGAIGTLPSRFGYRRRGNQYKSWNLRTERLTRKIYSSIVINEDSETSVMEGEMLWYLRFSRLFGCLFFSIPKGKTLSNTAVTWKGPYVIYAAVWLCLAFVRRATYLLSMPAKPTDSSRDFSDNVEIAFRALVLLKVSVNYACFCLGSARLLEFLQRATSFEMATSFMSRGRKQSHISDILLKFTMRTTLRICLAASFIAAMTTIGSRAPMRLPIGQEAVDFCGEAAFFFYDFVMYGTITRCSEVLVKYLNAEAKRLESCRSVETSLTFGEHSNSLSTVTAVRSNLCKINSLQACLDYLCGPAVVVSTATFLAQCCAYTYKFLLLDLSHLEFWLCVVYVTYGALYLVDMIFVNEDLRREASKLKETVKTLDFVGRTNDYQAQVRYLHNIIEPEHMGLTGANFFRLDSGLLITVGGAIITYGVILVQTGRG